MLDRKDSRNDEVLENTPGCETIDRRDINVIDTVPPLGNCNLGIVGDPPRG